LQTLLFTYAENELIKLPANKYTVREREMLIGSGILPKEFFEAARNPFVIGVGACEWWAPVGTVATPCKSRLQQ